MASNNEPRFDDSEDEEDFNPAPADLSDEEPTNDDADGDVRQSSRRHSSTGRDDIDDDDDPPRSKSRRDTGDDEEDDNAGDTRRRTRDDDEDEDEEEIERGGDDDEEDEEEEEDDEDDVQQGHRRKRRRDRRNAFFDIEAEVDDEDEEGDEEKEGEEIEDFIDNAHPDDIAESGHLDDDRRHRELDRRRDLENSMDAEKQAEILRQRYGNRRPAKGFGGTAVMPKRLLMPSVNDPGIWAVRCKEGKEREVIFSILKRVEERKGTKDEVGIISAFERGGPNSVMKGLIYVEANRQSNILVALDGLLNVYPRTKMLLVEPKQRTELLRVQKTPTLEPGAWVRLRRPAKHSGDLAQVLDVTENGLEARVRFIPRLDYGMRDDSLNAVSADGKRKRPIGMPGPRPPQRLFSEIEARKRHPRNVVGNPSTNTWSYMGDDFENGFQVKDVKIQQLIVTDVNPSLEEVTRFASGAEDGTENLDLKALAASLKDSSSLVTYLPGDVVEVYSGEQAGIVGKATNVKGDIVTMTVTEGDMVGQTIDVPTKGLRKRFRIGDHVKVIGGSKFRDEVGTVVNIAEDRVTLLTDQTHTEVTVFSKDLREASDIGGQGSLGQYSLHDLVQLDPTTVGCIVKVDRESLVVLDQFGDSRQVMPTQISNKIPKRKQAVAADRNGSEIRLDDVVKEFTGQQRQGKIIHIHRSYVFLHTNDTNENSGVFVTKASLLNTVAAKGGRVTAAASGPDLNAMNPALKIHKNGAENKAVQPAKSFGRDKAINQTVIIKKGAYKGLLGIVKDTTDTHARVELHTKSKTITVPRDSLNFKDKNTGATIDINGRGRGAPGGPHRSGPGDRVPGWQQSRTPMGAGASDRVPAWGSTPAHGGRTPAWKPQDSGSRTPAWADGSRTVNPYDGSRTAYGAGSRTPAWQSGAKTPAYGDAFGAGSRTPAYGGGDGWAAGSKTPAWGASAPTPGASGNDSWGHTPGASASGAYDAPTPGAAMGAPTPGPLNAPTPGAYSAPTPAASAPTPGAGWGGGWGADAAPTPAAGAPTPAASGGGYYGAPTPAAYGGAPETPAASGPRRWQDGQRAFASVNSPKATTTAAPTTRAADRPVKPANKKTTPVKAFAAPSPNSKTKAAGSIPTNPKAPSRPGPSLKSQPQPTAGKANANDIRTTFKKTPGASKAPAGTSTVGPASSVASPAVTAEAVRTAEEREASLRAARLRRIAQREDMEAQLVREQEKKEESQRRYKTAARKWVSSIVALPILLVTSYYLFDRCSADTRSPGPHPQLPDLETQQESPHHALVTLLGPSQAKIAANSSPSASVERRVDDESKQQVQVYNHANQIASHFYSFDPGFIMAPLKTLLWLSVSLLAFATQAAPACCSKEFNIDQAYRKQIADKYLAMWGGEVALAEEILSPEVDLWVDRHPGPNGTLPVPGANRDDFLAFLTWSRTGWDHFEFEPIHWAGDQQNVAIRWRLNAILGDFINAPTTLKRGDHVTFNGTDFLVINKCTGLVDEVNIAQDLLTFMRRMGFGFVVL
ncbi:Transcription elongation factor SPT5 [Paramyrothecium foliicola]|nr:Transcription elongation factor SPT5 [Paramyrothecium foliicola]